MKTYPTMCVDAASKNGVCYNLPVCLSVSLSLSVCRSLWLMCWLLVRPVDALLSVSVNTVMSVCPYGWFIVCLPSGLEFGSVCLSVCLSLWLM